MAKVLAPNIPKCLLFLVALSTVCNVLVLMGNFKTAASIEKIGASTEGWSNIGLRVSHALQAELDVVMVNLSDRLLDALNHTLHTSKILNTVVAAAAAAADHLEGSHATKAVSFLQSHMVLAGGPVDVLPGLLNTAINKMLNKLLKKAMEMLNLLLVKIKPVLLEIGKFMIRFGEKIQNTVEAFSITLDRVQKIFDQIMAQLSGGGSAPGVEMIHETFNLFDVSDTGFINKQDLKDVAKIYSVSAFAGRKSDALVEKYDHSNDSRLDRAEFEKLLSDSSLPNVMPVLLRQYSKKLVEVAGNVASARQRDEVAGRVVDYLQLVVAKNLTKMRWIADTLSNASLPLEFTADIMAELALAADDQDALTTEDVGKVVVHEMMKSNTSHVTLAYKHISNPKRWVEEGYHSADHPKVLKLVTTWMSPSPNHTHMLLQMLQQGFLPDASSSSYADEQQEEAAVFVETDSVESMSQIAFDLGAKNMKVYLNQREADSEKMYTQLFATKTSRTLRSHLLGGTFSSDDQHDEAERAVKSGVPAAPATLAFAQWLAANASATSKRFQSMCFNSTKQSSNAIDSFANQIQGMVKKVSSFLSMMTKYSTPAGIAKLESQVRGFADHAGKDLLKVISKKVGGFVNKSAPVLNKTIDSALDSIGNSLGYTLAKAIGTPLGKALTPVLSTIMGQFLNKSSASSQQMGKELANILGKEISDVSGDVLGHQLGKLLHDMINTLLVKAVNHLNKAVDDIPGLNFVQSHTVEHVPLEEVLSMLNDHAALHLEARNGDSSTKHLNEQVETALTDTQNIAGKIVQAEFSDLAMPELSLSGRGEAEFGLSDSAEADDTFDLSGVWTEVAAKLRSFSNIMPQASKLLKLARLEVSKLASHLDSIFAPFKITGPRIFADVGHLYRVMWTMYFCLQLPLVSIIVLYGFWAGGFFGGPGSASDQEEDDGSSQIPEEEKTMRYKIWACCASCCHCIRVSHDRNLCFWSFILLAQLIVVLAFIVALVFTILGGVKMFVSAGCEQIYVLNDSVICGQTLQSIRQFLGTFLAERAMEELPKTCIDETLLACEEIGAKMQISAALTTVFGFIGALVTFQMIVESSILHTRAVMRKSLMKKE